MNYKVIKPQYYKIRKFFLREVRTDWKVTAGSELIPPLTTNEIFDFLYYYKIHNKRIIITSGAYIYVNQIRVSLLFAELLKRCVKIEIYEDINND